MMKIDITHKDFPFLSPMHLISFQMMGDTFPSIQHCFQYRKTMDADEREMIMATEDPYEVWEIGHKTRIREDWFSVRIHVLQSIVTAKFRCNREFAIELVETGHCRLLWENDVNNFWGVVDGSGLNNYGKILMKTRKNFSKLQSFANL